MFPIDTYRNLLLMVDTSIVRQIANSRVAVQSFRQALYPSHCRRRLDALISVCLKQVLLMKREGENCLIECETRTKLEMKVSDFPIPPKANSNLWFLTAVLGQHTVWFRGPQYTHVVGYRITFGD